MVTLPQNRKMTNEYKYSASDFLNLSGWTKDQYSELFKDRKISQTKTRSILRPEEIDENFSKFNTGRNRVFCKHQLFYLYLYNDFTKAGFSPNYFTPTLATLKRYWEIVSETNPTFSLINQIYSPQVKLESSVVKIDLKKMNNESRKSYGQQHLYEIEEYQSFLKLTKKYEHYFQLGWTLEKLSNNYGDWIHPQVVEYCFIKIDDQWVVKSATLFPNLGREKVEGKKWGEEKILKKSGISVSYIPTHSLHTKTYARLDLGEVFREFMIKFKDL